jgi:hypothetical protein
LVVSVNPQPNPPPGWYSDPSGAAEFRWWDGQSWVDQTRTGDARNPGPAQTTGLPYNPGAPVQGNTRVPVRSSTGRPVGRYNQRIAKRIARRAHTGQEGVAVCFAYNNLATTLVIGTVEEIARFIPSVGGLIELVIGLLTFYFHRIVLVTDESVYVYRDWPFHIPGKQLAAYSRHAGVVNLGSPNPGGFSGVIRRGQLNFDDGHVVYHSILWIRRARYIVQEANTPTGH